MISIIMFALTRSVEFGVYYNLSGIVGFWYFFAGLKEKPNQI